MNSSTETWNIICEYCKQKMTSVAFNTWFSRIEPISMDFKNNNVVLMVPNKFHKKTILNHYIDLLKKSFSDVFGIDTDIDIIVEDDDDCKEKIYAAKNKNNTKENLLSKGDYEYTFETFIVGSSNKFAHAACIAVSTKPADSYNPLFIYGNSGLGKTHLLHAIKNEINSQKPELNILYIKGDDFTNELIESIRNGSTLEFHDKYRNTDVLLVDDIQFIAGKDSTQEEFFHTFNTLHDSRKQIVLTSDRPPKEIKTLEDRLRTRFEWGLIADIQPPDYETRIAIIKRKAEIMDFKISDEICNYIANKLKSNIRQLEGTVKKIRAYSLLTNEEPNMAVVKSAVSEILNNDQPPPVTVEKIISEVSKVYNVTPEDIRSSKRASNISNARKLSMYLIREITQMSLNLIGDEFGGRDHSTVVYAIKQVEKEIEKDKRMREIADDLKNNLKNS